MPTLHARLRRPATDTSTQRGVGASGPATAQLVGTAYSLNQSPRVRALLDLKADLPSGTAPVQREAAPNRTGLPDGLKAGVEAASGVAMDSTRVRYNSPEPARLGALAFARGNEIHLGPGQERHLPHEAWHVVQQAQGRVRANLSMKGGTPVNSDPALEQEADRMGSLAARGPTATSFQLPEASAAAVSDGGVAQCVIIPVPGADAIDTDQLDMTELTKLHALHAKTPGVADKLAEVIAGRKFHQNWQDQRDAPKNAQHPNWLPPPPVGLKGKKLNEFMRDHSDVYPTVHVFNGDSLTHFTTSEGRKGIESSGKMYPSVVAGMATTHYGRGVYFNDQSPEDLGTKTHADVTRAIYTRDSEENRRRSEHLMNVDLRDHLVLKHSLSGKQPVYMYPTTEPMDVTGKTQSFRTSDKVREGPPPPMSAPSKGAQPGKKKPPKPPSVPQYPLVEDIDLARRDYETAKWVSPKDFGGMSFAQFLKEYRQSL